MRHEKIADGERIRFTRHDKELGVRSGDLGTVTRLGQDRSMTVQLDSGKTAEVSTEKSRLWLRRREPERNRAERVIATGDCLTQQVSRERPPKASTRSTPELPAPALEFTAAKENHFTRNCQASRSAACIRHRLLNPTVRRSGAKCGRRWFHRRLSKTGVKSGKRLNRFPCFASLCHFTALLLQLPTMRLLRTKINCIIDIRGRAKQRSWWCSERRWHCTTSC